MSCSLKVEHHSSKVIIWVRLPTRQAIRCLILDNEQPIEIGYSISGEIADLTHLSRRFDSYMAYVSASI